MQQKSSNTRFTNRIMTDRGNGALLLGMVGFEKKNTIDVSFTLSTDVAGVAVRVQQRKPRR